MQVKLRNLALRNIVDIGQNEFMSESALTDRQKNFIKFMQINNLSFVDVSDKSGVPYSTLKSFTTKPGQSLLGKNEQKLTAAFEISSEDIFVNPIKLGESTNQLRQSPLSTSDGHIVQIPEYDIKIAAGGGYIVDHEDIKGQWSFARDYIVGELSLNPQTLSMVEVVGDSMYPTLQSRDRVLVNHSDRNPFDEGVFAIWNGYGTVVKRIEVVPATSPAKLVLISDNKNHNQYEVTADDVNIIGRVVWFARRM